MGLLKTVLNTRLDQLNIGTMTVQTRNARRFHIVPDIQQLVLDELKSGHYKSEPSTVYEALKFLVSAYNKSGHTFTVFDESGESIPEGRSWLAREADFRRITSDDRSQIMHSLGLNRELINTLNNVYNGIAQGPKPADLKPVKPQDPWVSGYQPLMLPPRSPIKPRAANSADPTIATPENVGLALLREANLPTTAKDISKLGDTDRTVASMLLAWSKGTISLNGSDRELVQSSLEGKVPQPLLDGFMTADSPTPNGKKSVSRF